MHLDFAETESGSAEFAGLAASAPAPLGAEPVAAVPITARTAAPEAGAARGALPSDLQAYLDRHEREILVRALQDSGFNRTAAATRLGLSLRQIRYRIARLGISTPGGDDGVGGGGEE